VLRAFLTLLAILLTPAGGPAHLAAQGGPVAPAGAAELMTYSAPVPPPVVVARPFDPPPGPYAAGHRGVDLATARAATVVAAGAGWVTFAGLVAGRGVVVIAHPDGVSTEYEPVMPLVRAGQGVKRGDLIGRVSGRHGDCPPDRCLHWGAKRAGTYLDPMRLLLPLGPVRLVPLAAGFGMTAQARGWARL
jgi:murein DD-endopeptidase MepM/ murein hydrolase activator NlpD